MIRTAHLRVILLSLLLCSYNRGQFIGYGVILWSDKGLPLQNGSLVLIQRELETDKMYLVQLEPDGDSLKVPTWWIQFCPTREEANEFVSEYNAFWDTYGFVERDGLPVRKKASTNPDASIIVSLEKGQIIKIVSRGESKDTSF